MTEALGLSGHEKVLEVGTGSGYQTAVLARLAGEVVSVERHPALAETASERLRQLGLKNVRLRVGDGTLDVRPMLHSIGSSSPRQPVLCHHCC